MASCCNVPTIFSDSLKRHGSSCFFFFFFFYVLFSWALCSEAHYARPYMSNGMIHIQRSSANLRVCSTSSDWLKVDLWIHGPVAAGTSHSERLLFVGLPLCDVSAATGSCIQKSTFNQSEFA